MSASSDPLAAQRAKEEVAMAIAGLAMDIDAVAVRAGRQVDRLERLDAEPNAVVAARCAVETLAEAARALRRDGLLRSDQQRLL
ncbi:MAG: hypothetical protein H0T98_05195 [Euzebyaceae bacterium]|nr:hypothetical protein [Euzebyaceae bacterium]